MSTRPLTAEDREAARIFAAALKESGKTHEQVAVVVDVSAGMIHQWAKPLRKISLRSAPLAAYAVGIDDPAKISVDYREWIATFPRSMAPPGYVYPTERAAPPQTHEQANQYLVNTPDPSPETIADHLAAIASVVTLLPASMRPAIGKLLEAIGNTPADPSLREALVQLLNVGKKDPKP